MKFNPKIKHIFTISAWVLVVGTVLVLMSFAGKQNGAIICKGVLVNIEDENIKGFIDRNDIMDIIKAKGNKVLGKPMADININVLEKIMDSNPYVFKAEVYSTIDGWLHVDIKQRSPLVRIINTKDESFYIDEQGKFMPLSEKFTEPVLVATGAIFDNYVQKQVHDSGYYAAQYKDSVVSLRTIDQVYLLANRIAKDTMWDAIIEQIYVNQNQEIELVPRLGNQIILFGDASDMEDKLSRLKTIYTQGLNATGWEQYDIINLKFKGQVVCRKKDFKSQS